MKNFAYAIAPDISSASEAAVQGAQLVAGGTEILNWMRLGIVSADRVIDITRLPELSSIDRQGDEIRIGALATLNQIEGSDIVRQDAPVLSQACLLAASAQLRNRATIGGNVLQKTRCPYFRAEAATGDRMPWPCNKRVPGSGCSAREGDFSRAALFGATEACVATQPSDPAVALVALDAEVDLVGPSGSRSIPITRFHVTQSEAADLARTREGRRLLGGDAPETPDALIENRLMPGEIIVAYRFSVDTASRNSAYVKLRERESYEYAMASAAVCLDQSAGQVRQARVALGSIAQKPWRLSGAEAALSGQTLDEARLTSVLATAFSDAEPLPHQDYKVKVAQGAVRRALTKAGGSIQ